MNSDHLDTERQDNIRMLAESAQAFATKASPLTRARGLRGSASGFDRSFSALANRKDTMILE